MPPTWQWDASRRQYYLYNERDNVYEYQHGLRIPGPAPAAAQPQNAPRTLPTGSGYHGAGNVDDLSQQMSQTSISPGYGGYTYGQASSSMMPDDRSTATAIPIPTDQRLVSLGIQAKGAIGGASALPRDAGSKLYPEYKVQKPGKKFFRRGKVFKVLWPELLGQNNESITVTSDGRFGSEQIASKIRWFIVVMEGENFSTCLPINTYKRQGVSKRGVVKSNHAIAYHKSTEPEPQPLEVPSRDEAPMMPGIRIRPKHKRDVLDKWSRIDFARMYTVEHNVKVYDFGDVDKAHHSRLVTQWFHIIEQGTKMQTQISNQMNMGGSGSTTAVEEEDEDDDDEDDEEEESEDDEDEDDDEGDEEEEDDQTKQARAYAQYQAQLEAHRQYQESQRKSSGKKKRK